jgi:hypothetical protein
MDAPLDWPPGRWPVLIEDAQRFVTVWGAQAHQLGWTAVDLFGCHPVKPWWRLDVAGLVLLLAGKSVVALTEDEAAIAASRRPMIFRRLVRKATRRRWRTCLLWELTP